MRKLIHTNLIMLTLGFFLLPMLSHACGIKTEKACCTKEVSSESTTKKCCKDGPIKKEHKGCDGKCGHANCTSTSVISIFALVNEVHFNITSFDFSSEKQQFYNSKTFLSDGFSSLWLIPKIG